MDQAKTTRMAAPGAATLERLSVHDAETRIVSMTDTMQLSEHDLHETAVLALQPRKPPSVPPAALASAQSIPSAQGLSPDVTQPMPAGAVQDLLSESSPAWSYGEVAFHTLHAAPRSSDKRRVMLALTSLLACLVVGLWVWSQHKVSAQREARERRAAELYAAERFEDALSQYRLLAHEHPELGVYAQTVRILSDRIGDRGRTAAADAASR
ncbi:MAG: hypothetical protein QM778_21700 [Myxococcales bacterium]